jgi:hypothetical protein
MRARCSDTNNNRYSRYGGRGIVVCHKWQHSFEAFVADMGLRPKGMTLGRQDNNKPYCKQNCRWETAKQQSRNTTNTVYVKYNNKRLPIRDVADLTGVNPKTLWQRHKQGRPLCGGVRSDSLTGIKGVTKHSRRRLTSKPFQARISVDGQRISLGYFTTAEQAHKAYSEAAHKHFGEYANV